MSAPVCRLPDGVSGQVRWARSLSWRLLGKKSLDEAYVPFFGVLMGRSMQEEAEGLKEHVEAASGPRR